MRRRVFRSLLILWALGSCTRLPAPVPIPVSTVVPERLMPVRFTVSGQVLDADTRQPLPDIQVRGIGYEATTDAQGRFAYVALAASGAAATRQLSVRTPQYLGQVTYVPGQNQQVLLLAQRRQPPMTAFAYEPDSCHSAQDRVHFNPQATLPWQPGQLHAWFIENRQPRPGDTLRTVTFRGAQALDLMDDWREPLRLRIMAVDPVTQGPGADLLLENQIVAFPAAGHALTFYLREYRIGVPTGGFYVALEPFLAGSLYSYQPEKYYHPQGRILRAPCAFAATRSWTASWKPGAPLGWQPIPAARNCWPLLESLIQLEVD